MSPSKGHRPRGAWEQLQGVAREAGKAQTQAVGVGLGLGPEVNFFSIKRSNSWTSTAGPSCLVKAWG